MVVRKLQEVIRGADVCPPRFESNAKLNIEIKSEIACCIEEALREPGGGEG
jgi:hypothetical protein